MSLHAWRPWPADLIKLFFHGMEVQRQTLQHPSAFLKGHSSQCRSSNFPSENVCAFHVNSFRVCMADQFPIDGMHEGVPSPLPAIH